VARRAPDPDEAAAISAAVERFLAETSAPVAEPGEQISAWHRAALLEGISAKATIAQGKGGERWLS
jgi:hypothetical protein